MNKEEELTDILQKVDRGEMDIAVAFDRILRLFSVSNNEVAVGCGTCEHKHLLMSDKPCLNCVGRYSEWKQTTDC